MTNTLTVMDSNVIRIIRHREWINKRGFLLLSFIGSLIYTFLFFLLYLLLDYNNILIFTYIIVILPYIFYSTDNSTRLLFFERYIVQVFGKKDEIGKYNCYFKQEFSHYGKRFVNLQEKKRIYNFLGSTYSYSKYSCDNCLYSTTYMFKNKKYY